MHSSFRSEKVRREAVSSNSFEKWRIGNAGVRRKEKKKKKGKKSEQESEEIIIIMDTRPLFPSRP